MLNISGQDKQAGCSALSNFVNPQMSVDVCWGPSSAQGLTMCEHGKLMVNSVGPAGGM